MYQTIPMYKLSSHYYTYNNITHSTTAMILPQEDLSQVYISQTSHPVVVAIYLLLRHYYTFNNITHSTTVMIFPQEDLSQVYISQTSHPVGVTTYLPLNNSYDLASGRFKSSLYLTNESSCRGRHLFTTQ